MNVKHSPPKSKNESENVSQRRRKQPDRQCDCESEIRELRLEFSHVTELLEKTIAKQDITLEKMQENLTAIKNEMQEIKNITSNLVMEQNNIRSDISKLNIRISDGETKMQNIESSSIQISSKLSFAEEKLHALESDFKCKVAPGLMSEEIISEIQERNNRTSNIIISGLPEPHDTNTQNRHQNDMQEVMKILNILTDNPQKPTKIFRIGKYNKDKNRHIKICFTSSDIPRLLMRNRAKLNSNIKIFPDQTPMQHNLFKKTKVELESRIAAGETGLTIKYIKGVPRVTKIHPAKN